MKITCEGISEEETLNIKTSIGELLKIGNLAHYMKPIPPVRCILVTYLPMISWGIPKYAADLEEVCKILKKRISAQEKEVALESVLTQIIEKEKELPPSESVESRYEKTIQQLMLITREQINETAMLGILELYFPNIRWSENMIGGTTKGKATTTNAAQSITKLLQGNEQQRKKVREIIWEKITPRTLVGEDSRTHRKSITV